MSTLDTWRSKFGDDYVDRNMPEQWRIEQAANVFCDITRDLPISSVLEMGCGTGINLSAFCYKPTIAQLETGLLVCGVEPNAKARKIAIDNGRNVVSDLTNLVYYSEEAHRFDLVFTCGVLIHVNPKELKEFTDKIVSLSSKYVLAVEYFSHEPVEMEYRGEEGLLWKRDFGSWYLDNYPKLKTVDYGFIWQREFSHFDNLNWWLFEKVEINDNG